MFQVAIGFPLKCCAALPGSVKTPPSTPVASARICQIVHLVFCEMLSGESYKYTRM